MKSFYQGSTLRVSQSQLSHITRHIAQEDTTLRCTYLAYHELEEHSDGKR